jgi:hypothetical protein
VVNFGNCMVVIVGFQERIVNITLQIAGWQAGLPIDDDLLGDLALL